MEIQLSKSSLPDDIIIANAELRNKSWSLLATLLAVGRPVDATELASRCDSFETSPEFIKFLSCIANSPLSLTNDGLVTVSSAVYIGLKRFFLNSSRRSESVLPRELKMEECGRKRVWEDVQRTYHRKRKRFWQNVYEKADQMNLATPIVIQNARAKVHIHAVDDLQRSVIMNAGYPSVSLSNDNKPDEMTIKMSSVINFNAGLLCFGSDNGKHESEREMDAILSMKEIGGSGGKACLQFSSSPSSHPTASSVVQIEHVKDECCLLGENCSASSCQEDDKDKIIPFVKSGIDLCSRFNGDLTENQRLMGGGECEPMINSVSHKGNNAISRDMLLNFDFGNGTTVSCNDMKTYSDSGKKASCQDDVKQSIVSPAEAEILSAYEAQMVNLKQEKRVICGREEQLVGSPHGDGDDENLRISVDLTCNDYDKSRTNTLYDNTLPNLDENNTAVQPNLITCTGDLISLDQKQLAEFSAKLKVVPKDSKSPTVQTLSLTTVKGNDACAQIEQPNCKKDKRSILMKQKLKPNFDQKNHTQGKRENSKEYKEKPTSISVKDHSEPRVVPTFDSYIVEEEEGSGGYGTVYKARRKTDGTTFAIKYPHANANKHHVNNELKMLERFGGKNFVMKFEGSFKNGNSHCLVLEHVAHDRPEILKREIDVYQLRWYGYCLFRALASLHKQGVVHRDVKPGNFLFSRKATKGYLIDFNLAIDLHQKYGSSVSKMHNDSSFGLALAPPPRTESLPPRKTRKLPNSKGLEPVKYETGIRSKTLLFKNLKKKTDQVIKSQGADGSGITSTKEGTSTRVPSAERLREPIPCQGRKELLNLVHEAMQGPDHEVLSTPTSKRKRVAAPPVKSDKRFVYPTPMPLHSTGVAVVGAGLLKTKGEGKQRREGPCVGTKGFRAPEVLLRSTYQGPKVDIWSAGVTLLYLIIGRTPFVGDPDQNIKEIAKLRGSEDLWEVAKLHDRESSFPPELFQIQSLPSTKLREWCKQNTRRPDFLDVIPRSLVDLVDKCLTVNPRSRLSAEDALKHEFFAPCFESLKQQRLLRQGLSLDSPKHTATAL